jgi:enoyl-CoA hydratase/carnithine racemase
MDFGGGDEIRFERRGRIGIVTLTRPRALNALTLTMVRGLAKALDAWETDDAVAAVLVRGEGRAFCAGGDIVQVYESRGSGNPPVGFFAEEYRLNARIARLRKPYIALIDGIVMGGGVGISGHGSHRVMSENALFAMPEVGIGFFPDVGGSHLLPRLARRFGFYLGLTGNRIRHGDALWSGLATHTIKAADQEAFVASLAESGDPDAVLADYHAPAPRESEQVVLDAIDDHFSKDSLADVVSSLEEAAGRDEFAARTLATIRTRSPTSLNVAFREIASGAALSMDDCMRMEFRILNRMLAGHDFYEGIRAAVIEKGTAPAWQPARLEDVDEAAIDAYFAPLGDGELTL